MKQQRASRKGVTGWMRGALLDGLPDIFGEKIVKLMGAELFRPIASSVFVLKPVLRLVGSSIRLEQKKIEEKYFDKNAIYIRFILEKH